MAEQAFRVTGRVQGVGFRWWTRSHARALGVNGSVRNCADGSVEVQLRGERAALDEMLRLLGEGPAGAQIAGIQPIAPRPVPDGDFVIEPNIGE